MIYKDYAVQKRKTSRPKRVRIKELYAEEVNFRNDGLVDADLGFETILFI